mmetsp:Transcript_6865/g.25652  ORF Transcript_6865/g.25652 Transcript_6865/m.25652 type:complete len:118 (-) Transcript_6865:936-1289(-)
MFRASRRSAPMQHWWFIFDKDGKLSHRAKSWPPEMCEYASPMKNSGPECIEELSNFTTLRSQPNCVSLAVICLNLLVMTHFNAIKGLLQDFPNSLRNVSPSASEHPSPLLRALCLYN